MSDRAAETGVDPELLKEVRRLQITSARLVEDAMAGGWHSVFRGAGIEFDEVREWVEGDDVRSVDWNVTARTGRPFVKKYVEERELTLLFVLDRSRAMDFGTRAAQGRLRNLRRLAAELCACLGLSAQRNQDKVGLLAFGAAHAPFVPPKKGRAHLLRILRECLAAPGSGPLKGPPRGGLDEALAFAGRVLRRRAIVFVCSAFVAPAPEHRLRLLARRHDLILAPLSDPLFEEPPQRGLFLLEDPGGGAARWVDFGARRIRAAWIEHHRRRRLALESAARRAGADLLPLRTDRSVAADVLAFFRRREGRR